MKPRKEMMWTNNNVLAASNSFGLTGTPIGHDNVYGVTAGR